MLYIYRRSASNGARELAEALTVNSRRLNDLQRAHFGHGVRAGDTIICWGEHLDPIEGVRILNGKPFTNKLEDALKLKEAGVPTVEVSAIRPPLTPAADPARLIFEQAVEAAGDFVNVAFDRANPVMLQGIQQFTVTLTQLQQALNTPPPPPTEWLPRLFHHVGGGDLLRPPFVANYWSKKEDIRNEYRLHSFLGKSIRAGIKRPREGAVQHPWIRSYDGGWSIYYDGFTSTKPMRELAKNAVAALGLDFGAVDLAERTDGILMVLEVNRAPGLEGNTTIAYAEAIENWMNGDGDEG